MSTPLSPPIRFAIKIATVILLSIFVLRAWEAYVATRRLNFLLLLVAETLTVVLYLTAAQPRQTSRRPLALMATFLGTFYFLFLDLRGGHPIVPDAVSQSMQCLGLGFQIVSKLYLGRRFGLVAANRGIVTTGPYRIVRHPIYLGYFIAHIGFLISAWSGYNCLVFASLYGLQAVRIHEEERLLANSPEYANYRLLVRFRFLPYLF